jgi:hypothetical protein
MAMWGYNAGFGVKVSGTVQWWGLRMAVKNATGIWHDHRCIGTSQYLWDGKRILRRVLRGLLEAPGWRRGFGIARLPLHMGLLQSLVVRMLQVHGMRTM